jgi:hypothetical protein
MQVNNGNGKVVGTEGKSVGQNQVLSNCESKTRGTAFDL